MCIIFVRIEPTLIEIVFVSDASKKETYMYFPLIKL